MDSRSIPFPPQISFFLYSTPPSSAFPRRTPPLSTPPSRSRRLESLALRLTSARSVSFPPLLDPGGVCTGDREGRREWSSPRKRNTTSPAAIAGSPFNGSFVVAWEGVWQPCATSHPLSTPTFRSVGMREGERDGEASVSYTITEIENEMDILYVDKEEVG